jgi:epoxyqueuosine reductase
MNISELKSGVSSFLQSSKSNRIPELGGITIYDEPLIGIASADDPLFLKLKDDTVVGKIHMTPQEWFKEAVSVISYFLPFSEEIRISNRHDKTIISTEWLYGRIEGEALNSEVRRLIAQFIADSGGKAFIPTLDPNFKWVGSTSNWSERHVAYIAGLGTFGLHKSLITEKGCAGRFGSVITNLEFTPVERKYSGLYEYCSMCMACVKRCPGNAIDETGKKHQPCFDFLGSIMKIYAPRYGCGKCQTKVPCEDCIPKK